MSEHITRSSPRIVSLLSSATEMVCQLGLSDQLLAISHECNYPPEIQGRPQATRSRVDSSRSSQTIDDQVKALVAAGQPLYEINRELLAELQPDLIVTQAQCDVCAVKYLDVMDFVQSSPTLEKTRVIALNPTSLDDVLADMERIGRAANCGERAQQVVTQLRQRIARVREQTQTLAAAARPRVVCIEWTEPLMIASNWTPQLLEWAGGTPGLATAGQHSRYVSWDELAKFDPEVIVVAPCGFDLPRTLVEAQTLLKNPRWSQLAAVRAGRVFAVDGDAYLNRSGPRLVDSLEILAHLLHPQRFPTAPTTIVTLAQRSASR